MWLPVPVSLLAGLHSHATDIRHIPGEAKAAQFAAAIQVAADAIWAAMEAAVTMGPGSCSEAIFSRAKVQGVATAETGHTWQLGPGLQLLQGAPPGLQGLPCWLAQSTCVADCTSYTLH